MYTVTASVLFSNSRRSGYRESRSKRPVLVAYQDTLELGVCFCNSSRCRWPSVSESPLSPRRCASWGGQAVAGPNRLPLRPGAADPGCRGLAGAGQTPSRRPCFGSPHRIKYRPATVVNELTYLPLLVREDLPRGRGPRLFPRRTARFLLAPLPAMLIARRVWASPWVPQLPQRRGAGPSAAFRRSHGGPSNRWDQKHRPLRVFLVEVLQDLRGSAPTVHSQHRRPRAVSGFRERESRSGPAPWSPRETSRRSTTSPRRSGRSGIVQDRWPEATLDARRRRQPGG